MRGLRRVDLKYILAIAVVARFSCVALSNIPIFNMTFTFLYVIIFCIFFFWRNYFTKIEFVGMLFMLSYVLEVAVVTVPENGLFNTHAFNAYVLFALYSIYLYQKRLPENKRRVLMNVTLLGFCFTYIYSIIKLAQDPMLSRKAAASLITDNSVDTLQAIGGFDTVYGSLIVFIILLYIVSCSKSQKNLFIAMLIACVVFIIMATYATAIIILIIAFGLFLFQRNRLASFICLILAVGGILFREVIGQSIMEFSREITYSSMMQEKTYQVGYMLKFGESVGTLAGEDGRLARMVWSWKAFIASPLFGSYNNSALPIGCHSEIFDTLGRFGLWGGISIIGFFVCCIKDILDSFEYEITRRCTILVIIIYLAVCILDPGLYTQQVIPILILLPLMELGYSTKTHAVMEENR